MFPDNDTPGVVSMLNSHSLVDKYVEDSENCTYTQEEIESYIIEQQENEMDTQPPEEQQQQQQQVYTAASLCMYFIAIIIRRVIPLQQRLVINGLHPCLRYCMTLCLFIVVIVYCCCLLFLFTVILR